VIFFQIQVKPMDNFSYIVADDNTKEAVVVDAGTYVETIIAKALSNNLNIKYIISTHEHSDHTAGNKDLALATNAKIVAHRKSRIYKDIVVEDGNIIKIGEIEIRIIHTPGHTKDSICLLVENKLFTGDTLFVGECGRVDLPGGSATELYDSLFTKILALEEDVEILPGHNYGTKPYSTLNYEREHNHVLQKRTREEFAKFMSNN